MSACSSSSPIILPLWVVKPFHFWSLKYTSTSKLHWFPVCFQMSFKELVVTYKALYGIGSYLKDFLSPIITWEATCLPIQFDKFGALFIPSVKQFHLSASQKHTFSVAVHALWNEVPPSLQDLNGPHSIRVLKESEDLALHPDLSRGFLKCCYSGIPTLLFAFCLCFSILEIIITFKKIIQVTYTFNKQQQQHDWAYFVFLHTLTVAFYSSQLTV